jgi:ATP-binding cassette subfamily B protein
MPALQHTFLHSHAIWYSLYLGANAAAVSRVYSDLVRSLGASKKLFYLMDLPRSDVSSLGTDLPPLLSSSTPAIDLAAARADMSAPVPLAAHVPGLAIEFDKVSFSYPQRLDQPVLDQLSLSIPAGAVVGFCGESGCGKSTLARLLTKLYVPTGGAIRINNQDINMDLTAQQVRERIGVVAQEALLFNRTVRENLVYGLHSTSEEVMIQAAKDANAHGFISKLPQGYVLVPSPVARRCIFIAV